MSERLKPQVKTIVTLTPRHGEDHPSSPALSRRPPLVIIHPDAQHPGKLVEGSLIQGWKAALGELALVYPDRINTYL